MAEHSMCHPGLPGPHGLSQSGPSWVLFQRAKSRGLRLSSCSSIRMPVIISPVSFPESLPYRGNDSTE